MVSILSYCISYLDSFYSSFIGLYSVSVSLVEGRGFRKVSRVPYLLCGVLLASVFVTKSDSARSRLISLPAGSSLSASASASSASFAGISGFSSAKISDVISGFFSGSSAGISAFSA